MTRLGYLLAGLVAGLVLGGGSVTAVAVSQGVLDAKAGVASQLSEAAYAVDNGASPSVDAQDRATRNAVQLLVRRVVQQELEQATDCIVAWHSGEPVANIYCPDEEAPPVR